MSDFYVALPGETAPAVPAGPKLCNGDDMRILHSAFLFAYPRMAELVRDTPPGDTARAAFVAQWLGDIDHTLRTHHKDEELLLFDQLAERAPACALHVGQMKAHHAQVHAILDEIEPLRLEWPKTADPDTGEQLADAYDRMLEVLEVHLRREVVEIVPVAEKVITAKEWAGMAERGTKAVPKDRLMSQLGMLLSSSAPEDRKQFFKNIPLPVRIMYRTYGRRQYEAQFRLLWPGEAVPQTV
ncbi:hemerythrin domain-containing protein [Planctomonas sp. JC2975]|uniref:hemerythrin domain-containing protein n=1 Tax=Planctomonas sp. JC2975 TaxID=2729626 RepID=UPI001475E454|nr:hemerythrin domain-containing protein [Planctomonas sp. JC2975]NNC13819.1 hemerythrin domain-containing protein [Planctomonas sp. JC2975]